MPAARHPMPPEIAALSLEEIAARYIGRFRDKLPELEPVYMQVMLGRGRPEAMGYADDDLYRRRDAHLGH